jgi:hypothetical protein
MYNTKLISLDTSQNAFSYDIYKILKVVNSFLKKNWTKLLSLTFCKKKPYLGSTSYFLSNLNNLFFFPMIYGQRENLIYSHLPTLIHPCCTHPEKLLSIAQEIPTVKLPVVGARQSTTQKAQLHLPPR